MHVSACLRLPCPFEWSSINTLLSINARHASKLTGLPIWLASRGAVARWAFGGAEGGYLPARRPSPCAGTDGAEGDEIRCGRRCGGAAAGGERAPATRTVAAWMARLAGAMTLLFGTVGRRPFPGRGRAGPCGRYGGQEAAEPQRRTERQRQPGRRGGAGRLREALRGR